MSKKPLFKMQTKIILLVCGVVALALFVANALITTSVESNVQAAIGNKAQDIARVISNSPIVIGGLVDETKSGEIQTYTNAVQRSTSVEFIVVFDMQGIRKSHRDPTLIGQHLIGGDEAPALQGEEYISYAEGTRGNSLRAFSPIFDSDGRQVGAVVVGILLDDVEKALRESHQIIYLATAIGLLIGIFSALLLSHNIKRTLFGLEPFEIAKLVEERSATLQSVREGILAVDKNAMITVANSEARRVLEMAGIPGNPIGQPVNRYIPHTRLQYVLSTGEAELDQEQNINGVAILTNRLPVIVDGEIVGAIATFRDMTEIRRLAEELTGISRYVEALRSQAHEFMNKLHVILGLVRLKKYDKLLDYINEIADKHLKEVEFVGHCIRDPIVGGFLLSKFSRAREMGIDMKLDKSSFLPEPSASETTHELVTIIGNLVDNALEAVKDAQARAVNLFVFYKNKSLTIEVEDSGAGISSEDKEQIFTKGYSTKASGRGFGLFLVARSVEMLEGKIEILSNPGEGARFKITLPYEKKGEGS